MWTLRAKGEAGVDLRIMGKSLFATGARRNDSATDCASKRSVDTAAFYKSAGDHQIHGLGAFAFLVWLHIEADALALIERLQSGRLHGGDVYEHVAPAIIWLDEAVAPLGVEKLHDSCLRHREKLLAPHCSAGPTPSARLDIHFRGKASATIGFGHSAGPQTEAERHCQLEKYTPTAGPWKELNSLI